MSRSSLPRLFADLLFSNNGQRRRRRWSRRQLQLESLERRELLANQSPFAPVISEPATAGQIVSPADVHMQINAFSDPDVGDIQSATEWQIWTTTGTIQPVWTALPVGGVEMVHLHLGDGTFQNSLAGYTELLPNLDYELRVRVRDSSGDTATQWSSITTRVFHTGPLSQVFPLELDDVATSPAPAWTDTQGGALVLPSGATPAAITLESAAGQQLLRFQGFDGLTNQVLNPAALSGHVDLRVRVSAGNTGGDLVLPDSNITFADDQGAEHTIYLPGLHLGPNQEAVYWIAQSGATYVGTAVQTDPDFSTPARGAPVPWTVAPGYRVDVVATGFQLPVNIAFVPNPGTNPSDPFYYVTELYGTIKVISRNGTVSNYATNLLNFDPTGNFPGSGEQGLSGIVVDPATGDVFATMVYSSVTGVESAPHYPKIVRFHSTDGGRTAATQTTVLQMPGETQGQSHFISNISIGPDDKLWVHNGDGFDASTALNLDSFRGKVLRVNFDGTAPSDNPFYDAANGINARDYVFAYGFRNPFGGAWRAADGNHYEVEDGPSVDRLARIDRGVSYGWNNTDASMSINAIYTWSPAVAPVNIAFVQPSTFGGSGFPASKQDHAFVTQSGPTYATGPQSNSKSITEFVLAANGSLVSGPTDFVKYNGTGKASVAGLAAGPDGLYFTDLYKDIDAATPIDPGANVLRIRFVGAADFAANVQQGAGPLSVQFTDLSTAPGATEWLWDFGDGTTSTQQNPTHTYNFNGQYSVRLSVTGANGLVTTRKQNFISVGPVVNGLHGKYYNNIDFTGTTFSRLDPTVNFNWGSGSPNASIAADTFSARWTGQVQPQYSQTYTFYTSSDDGVRLYVNGQLVINNWTDHAATENSGSITLVAGQKYDIVMEFYEQGGQAVATLSWSSPSQPKQIIPQNRLFTILPDATGPTATITPVSPDPRITPVDQIAISFNEPALGFDITDLRLSSDGGPNLLTSAQTLTTSDHVNWTLSGLSGLTGPLGTYILSIIAAGSGVTDPAGNALANLPTETFTIDTTLPGDGLSAIYYNNIDFTGTTITRVDPTVNFNWGSGTPNASIASDTFSVRWTGQVRPQFSETYTFYTTSDDGVRLFVNGQSVINNWTDHAATENSGTITLVGGQKYDIVMEYYEKAGQAVATLSWSSPSQAKQIIPQNRLFSVATDTVAPTASITPVAPDPANAPVGTITIQFSEPVSGFNLADLTLTRNGGANLLTASQTLSSSDNRTWTLGNLASLTGASGSYVLTLTAAGSGITDAAGNPLSNSPVEAFTVDTVAPTVSITQVSPDPRNSSAGTITIVFSEPVSGFNLADLTLTRNGGANLLTASQTLSSSDNQTWTLGNLSPLTGTSGSYVLTLTAAGSGIIDSAGNALSNSPTEAFVVDTVVPTASITPVTPDPRNTSVGTISIVFSEPVSGFNLPDLTLSLNGGANLLTASQTLTTSDNQTWTLSNLTPLTGTSGSYVLTLTAAGSGITDSAGNALSNSPTEAFGVDIFVPTASITPAAPDPRNTSVGTITIVFSEPVSGFNLADLTLTHNGGANLLTASQTLTTSDNQTWTLGNLSSLTGTSGSYVLTLTAAGSGIIDSAGNALSNSPTEAFVVDMVVPTASITPVSPDPASAPVGTITIVFSEPVSGFNLTNLTLSRDGGANLLTASQTLTTTDNQSWTLGNLSSLTAMSGSYFLTLAAAGSGVTDSAGNALANSPSEAFAVDTVVPASSITPVSPDPASAPVGTISIVFSEPVSGFNLADLTLTHNGGANLLTASQTLTTSDNQTWTLGNLTSLTETSGSYILTLTAAGSGITDAAGNPLSNSPAEEFVVDTFAPTVSITPVSPDPRNTAIGQITITFSEAISGFDLTDLRLTRNGSDNLLTAAQTLTTADNVTWVLGEIGSLTQAVGTYVLSLASAGSGISDAAGHALNNSPTEVFVVDTVAPAATITPVSPDPTSSPVDVITIVFSEPISGLDLADLSLTRDGGQNLLTASQTLTSSDNQTWTLTNLTSLTGTSGNYVLTLTAAGSGITDAAGNLLNNSPAEAFTVSFELSAQITPVTPDPRSTPASTITVQFNRAITGFDLADLSLTRNGGANLLTASQTLTTSDNLKWTLENLASLTSTDGSYVLTLTAAGSGIVDSLNNALTNSPTEVFAVDAVIPTATITPVSPNPANAPVGTITIAFSEPVSGFDMADLALTRNGGGNLLSALQTLTTSDNQTWTLGNLTSPTDTSGTYVLTLTAAGSGITDAAGNALGNSPAEVFAVDTVLPTASITPVSPDPASAPVGTITIVFSELVNGFNLADLTLSRDGGANLLTASQTLTSSDNQTWTLANLSSLTAASGSYVLTLTAAGSGITDAVGNALANSPTEEFVVDTVAPTASITPVSPDPASAPVSTISFAFSEPVSGFNLADLTLTRDGGTNLLTASQTLSTSDNQTWTLGNLSLLTGTSGSYVLTLTAAGSEITDGASNALSNSPTEAFVVDTAHPTATITAVSPDPRNSSVGTITIVFSEPVSGFNLAHLTLTRNGGANLLTASQTLTTSDNQTWTLGNLTSLTDTSGTYVLTLTAAGSGITDAAGNALGNSPAEVFAVDTVLPTASITPVSPDPASAPVGTITIVFSEPISGFNLADLTLSRDGGANLLTASQTLTSTDNQTWTLGNLASLIGTSGSYVLTLTAAGSGITDVAGNALNNSPTEAFVVDTVAPTATITAVSPDPRNASVATITIAFSEPVSGFNLADLTLTRGGGANLLTASQTLTTSDNQTWTLGNLTPLTGTSGSYVLTLTAAGSGITDTAGNALSNSPTEAFVVDTVVPTASFTPVSPDPRNASVGTITIIFSEPVSGFNLPDLTLSRNGGANLLTVSQTLSSSDNQTWTLGNLTSLTGTSGSYVLTLTATGSGITDAVGNALGNSPTEVFVVDTVAPTVSITPVSPDPASAPVGTITIVFSEPVSGFNLADLTLSRGGGANLLTASQTLNSSDNLTWTLGNLTSLTGVSGSYDLTLTAAGSGISDSVGNALGNSPVENFTVNLAALGDGLAATYYDNADFTGPTISRVDPTVNFNWGTGSPNAAIATDSFSARWTGQVQPQFSETYTFYTTSDDGVRLFVNGQLLIDNWTPHAAVENSGTITLVAGQKYDIVMEYFEQGGQAVATLSWSSASQAKQIVPQSRLFSAAIIPNGLSATYYDNIDLTGATLSRIEPTVNFNWGGGSPGTSIGVDTFSARWTGQVQPQFTETYTFYTVSDDGVRLSINGQWVVDNWTDHATTENSGTITLVGGQKYDLVMEYYEKAGLAIATLSWSSPSQVKQIIPQARLFSAASAPPAVQSFSALAASTSTTTIDTTLRSVESTAVAVEPRNQPQAKATASLAGNKADSSLSRKAALLAVDSAFAIARLAGDRKSLASSEGRTILSSADWLELIAADVARARRRN